MRTADRLVHAIMLDVWPDGPACLVDFGLDGFGGVDPQERYNALHYAVRNGLTADELHNAVVNGGLTELVNSYRPGQQEVSFLTANDMLSF
jgi:hypothetical protein